MTTPSITPSTPLSSPAAQDISPNVSPELFASTLQGLLKLHAPQAVLLAPLGEQVYQISADLPAAVVPGGELSPPGEWLDHGELRWLSQGGALLGLLWSEAELPESTTALLNLLLKSAQGQSESHDISLLLTHLPAPVAWLDAELRFRQVSRHFLTLHTLQHSAVLGRLLSEVFPGRSALPGLLASALAGQAVRLPLEAVAHGQQAAPLWVRGEARPYFDEQGIGVLWTTQDASEERGLARQLGSLLDDSGVMMAVLDAQQDTLGRVQNASRALMMLGAPGSEGQVGAGQTGAAQVPLLGTPLWEWPSWPAEVRSKIKALVQQAARGGVASAEVQTVRGEVMKLSVHGEGRGEQQAQPLLPTLLIAECHDVSALREVQQQAAVQHSLIAEILARSGEATLIVNAAGTVVLANEEAATLLGTEKPRLSSAPLGKLLKESGLQVYDTSMNRLDCGSWMDGGGWMDDGGWLRASMPPEQEIVLVNASGMQRTVRLSAHLLPSLEGQRPGLMLTFTDLTALRWTETRLRHNTQHDGLTGLLNRDGLRARLTTANPDSAVTAVTLLAVGISGFPALTAALGRMASDALLVNLAARLTEWRPGALVARLDRSVFMLALEHQEDSPGSYRPEDALQELHQHLKSPVPLSGQGFLLNVHLGAAGGELIGAGLGGQGDQIDDLIGQAETALSYALLGTDRDGTNSSGPDKASTGPSGQVSGRQRPGVVYREAMRAEVARDFRLEGELPAALTRGELKLEYQPVMSLDHPELPTSRTLVGAEALLRWEHPELGLLMPPDFLRLASRSRVISDIGEWVVRQALVSRLQWHAAHPGLRVSVNLSLDELLRQDDLERLFPIMQQYGPPDFELSAGSLLDYSERTVGLLERLRDLGARILVDDFGDGASNLSSLERFPISGVKLHPSFVGRLHHPRAYTLLEATTRLAGSLGLSVTAVGVETAEQLQLIRAAGVGAAQGYHFAAPMSAAELGEF